MGAAGHPPSCLPSLSAPPSERRQWQRIFAALTEMIRRRQGQVETLAGDSKFLQDYINLQHGHWSSKTSLLQSQISRVRKEEGMGRRVQAAKLALMVGLKQKEALCYKELLENAESDLEDFYECVETLNNHISGLKEKLEDRRSKATGHGVSEGYCDLAATGTSNEEEHHSSGSGEVRKWKQAYKKLSSEKQAEVSALLAEKDFAWNQLKKMESDYVARLKSKKIEIEHANEAMEKLKANEENLRSSASDKDEMIVKLKGDLSTIQLGLGSLTSEAQLSSEEMEKLHIDMEDLKSLVKEKDEMIAKLECELAKYDVRISQCSNRKIRPPSNSGSLTRSRGRSATPAGRHQKVAGSRSSCALQKQFQADNDTCRPRTANMGSRQCLKRRSMASISTLDGRPRLFTSAFKVPKLNNSPRLKGPLLH